MALSFLPAMAAIYPAIAIAAGNAFDTSFGELAIVSVACALTGVLLYALVVALAPRHIGPRTTALVPGGTGPGEGAKAPFSPPICEQKRIEPCK